MDTSEFVIWDMGTIASSGRPHARELYRDVLLASCSVPVLYPPVYLPVERDGQTYYEMHADGGVQRQVFFHGALVDRQSILEDARAGAVRAELYIIRNGKIKDPWARRNLAPRTTSLASRTIETLFEVTAQTQLRRLYVSMKRGGVDFNVAAIPPTFPDHDPTQFDLATMNELFDSGYRLAREGYDWLKVPPGLDLIEIADPLAMGSVPGGGGGL
jgi:predicted acylesterase/phospholipase RssA